MYHPHTHSPGLVNKIKHALTPHTHDVKDTIHTADEASTQGIRTAWISLAGMSVTAVLQLAIFAASGSVALLADTMHNVGHAVTTIPLIIAFRLGRRRATSRFPYGLRRAEDLVGVLISVVIAASAAYIIWESVRAFVDPRPLANPGWVLAAGIVGAAGNELVAVYRIRVGRRINSAALVAEGQHARADGLTSLAVVAGVAGVWAGFPQADAVVGLVIAAAILMIFVRTSRTIFRRLLDGVDDGTIEAIRNAAAAVEGVGGVVAARARWTGHCLCAEATIRVDAALDVAAGSEIASRVRDELRGRVPHLDDVVVVVTA